MGLFDPAYFAYYEDVEFTVIKLHHSSAGRMIFGRLGGGDGPTVGPPRRPGRPTRTDSTSSPA